MAGCEILRPALGGARNDRQGGTPEAYYRDPGKGWPGGHVERGQDEGWRETTRG